MPLRGTSRYFHRTWIGKRNGRCAPVLIDTNSSKEIRHSAVCTEPGSEIHAETWTQLQAAIADCKE